MSGLDWLDHAACTAVDPEVFFPPDGVDTPAVARQITRAKAICHRCPVRAECLEHALRRLSDGIAGGLTPTERRALNHARRGRKGRAA